ncbi:MAG: cupin domain-containing protein [Thermoleophilia bacterium]|nr:cupin domain-containing protein [Thermoleophilia bacterium]
MNEPAVNFAAIDPDGDTFQLLRRELGITSFGVNALILRPRQRLRVHRHERQEEVYLVLEGELTLIVEGEAHVLGRGRLARVGPESKRQLTNPSGDHVVVLALGGDGEHQGRDGIAWSSWDDEGEGRSPQEVPLPDDLPE